MRVCAPSQARSSDLWTSTSPTEQPQRCFARPSACRTYCANACDTRRHSEVPHVSHTAMQSCRSLWTTAPDIAAHPRARAGAIAVTPDSDKCRLRVAIRRSRRSPARFVHRRPGSRRLVDNSCHKFSRPFMKMLNSRHFSGLSARLDRCGQLRGLRAGMRAIDRSMRSKPRRHTSMCGQLASVAAAALARIAVRRVSIRAHRA